MLNIKMEKNWNFTLLKWQDLTVHDFVVKIKL